MDVSADVWRHRGRSLDGCLGKADTRVTGEYGGTRDRDRAAVGVETGVLEGLVHVLDRLGWHLFDVGRGRPQCGAATARAGCEALRRLQERGYVELASLLTSGRRRGGAVVSSWVVANEGMGVVLSLFGNVSQLHFMGR